jgi:hypothetical protein
MKIVALIIIMQLVVTLLTGCAEFQTKMDMMGQMNCKPPEASLCAGWKI